MLPTGERPFFTVRARFWSPNYAKGYLQAVDSFFQRNSADSSGGGLALWDTARARIDGVAFYQNTSNYGGGINNDAFMYVTDTKFIENEANEDGGAYFTGPGGTTLVTGLTFTGNLPNNSN